MAHSGRDYWYLIVLPRRLVQLLRARNHDVIFVQRSMFRWRSPPAIEWLARRLTGLPIAYHLDDGIWLAARQRWSRIAAGWRRPWSPATRRSPSSPRPPARRLRTSSTRSTPRPIRSSDHAASITGRHRLHRDRPRGTPGPDREPAAEVCEATGARVKVVGGLRRPELPGLDRSSRLAALGPRRRVLAGRPTSTSGSCRSPTPRSTAPRSRSRSRSTWQRACRSSSPRSATTPASSPTVREGFFAATPEEWTERLERLVGCRAAGRDGAQRPGADPRALRPAPRLSTSSPSSSTASRRNPIRPGGARAPDRVELRSPA